MAASAESNQHRRKVVVKMGFGLKQYILHQCWLGKFFVVGFARFFSSVVRVENLFSCKHQHEYQIVEISQARAWDSFR